MRHGQNLGDFLLLYQLFFEYVALHGVEEQYGIFPEPMVREIKQSSSRCGKELFPPFLPPLLLLNYFWDDITKVADESCKRNMSSGKASLMYLGGIVRIMQRQTRQLAAYLPSSFGSWWDRSFGVQGPTPDADSMFLNTDRSCILVNYTFTRP